MDWSGKRNLGSGFPLGSRASQKRSRRRQNPGGLGAHAQDASASRGQDFEVQLIEAHAKFFAGPAQSFFNGLAGEFVIGIAEGSHVSVVSLVDPEHACACWVEPLRPPMPIALPA